MNTNIIIHIKTIIITKCDLSTHLFAILALTFIVLQFKKFN